MLSLVAFAGSRSLPPSWAPRVLACVRSVHQAGRSITTGCCTGLDALVVGSALSLSAAPALTVFSIGTSEGAGFWRFSQSLSLLSQVPQCGGLVLWSAGGGLDLPLSARLSRRTRALIASASRFGPGSGVVCFFRTSESRGTFLAARCGAQAGLPVLAFAPPGVVLPALAPGGAWVPSGRRGCWSGSFLWSRSQESLT
jgi:hypothetical protein